MFRRFMRFSAAAIIGAVLMSVCITVFAASAELTVNISGEETAYPGDKAVISVTAEMAENSLLQGIQVDFGYSDDFPSIIDEETVITYDDTNWFMANITRKNLLTVGSPLENAARIEANIVFQVPEDAVPGTVYTVSIDDVTGAKKDDAVHMGSDGVDVLNNAVTVTVKDFPEIEGVIADNYSGIYDGKEHSPDIQIPSGASIRYGTSEGDYSLSSPPKYKDAGEYEVFYEITMDRHKTKTGSVVISIDKKPVSADMIGDIEGIVYTGAQIRPEVIVSDGTPSIITDKDYTIEYGENINVADGGSVAITGQNNYTGSAVKKFEILKADMKLSAQGYKGTFDGQSHTGSVQISSPKEAELKFGTAEGIYTLSTLPEYINAGSYTVYYNAVYENYNDCTGSISIVIEPKTITEDMISDPADAYYTGSAIRPDIIVSDGELMTAEDYMVEYGENINAAEGGSVTVIGRNNYTGSITKKFNILPIDFTEGTITAASYSGVYDGNAHSIAVSAPEGVEITYGSAQGKYDISASPEYKNAGAYTVYFKVSKPNYNDYVSSAMVTISAKELTEAMVGNIADTVYTGSQLMPSVSITDGSPSIITENDYTLAYGENINVSTGGTVVITAKGNYTGTVTRTFNILNADMTIASENYSGTYDGASHSGKLSVSKPAAATILYGIAEGTYDMTAMPEYVNAGTYTVYYKVTAPNFNDFSGSITVAIAPKEITADMISDTAAVTYTGVRHTPAVEVTDGMLITENDYTIAYGENINSASGGTVTVTGQGNYTGSVTKSFVINKAPLNISAESCTAVYGDAVNINISYSGFVNGETNAVIKKPALAGGFDAIPNVGTYNIILSGMEADNYTPVYQEGAVLTVTKRPLTITAMNVLDKDYDGNTSAVVDTSSIIFDGIVGNDDITVDKEKIKAEFADLNVGENIPVSITGISIIGDKAGNYELMTTEFGTAASILAAENAAYIASRIESLTVEKDAAALSMPELPQGFRAEIKSSGNESIIGRDGSITPSAEERTVDIVLTIVDETTGETADTKVITVTVPASTQLEIKAVTEGGGKITGAGTYFMNTEAVLKAEADEGYVFDGWYLGDEKLSSEAEYKFTVRENISLTAKFTEKTKPSEPSHGSSGGGGGGGSSGSSVRYWTVRFNSNGGSIVKDMRIQRNVAISEPTAPVKEGYVFSGWFTDVALTKKYDFKRKVTSDMTLYAGWISADKVEATTERPTETTTENTADNSIVMTINSLVMDIFGESYTNDVAPVIVNSRTMLPIRVIAEALGGNVEWDTVQKKTTITKADGKAIEIYINSDTAYVDGHEAVLDSPAFIENSRTYIPIRFVSEEMGAVVSWNAENKQVIITK